MLLEDSLRGLDLVRREEGPVVDVGSGGGAPGIPLADALPQREFVLLEATGRKCDVLRGVAPANARVLQGRAEEQETDWAGCALAKALAPPPSGSRRGSRKAHRVSSSCASWVRRPPVFRAEPVLRGSVRSRS